MTNTIQMNINHDLARKESSWMDAWTELNLAAIRDRMREREVEAAGERLALIARSAAAAAKALRLLVASRRPAAVEPAQIALAAAPAAECEECPPAVQAA
jgi:hypothetical protein